MELKNALSTSSEASLLSRHKTYSITDASHGNVILPSSPAKPNSSRDMVRSSPKTAVPRYSNGTSNRAPSANGSKWKQSDYQMAPAGSLTPFVKI
ncbi:hypothetical protein OsI_32263 [Oryza sativa Indica Group]|uniref:Uncharacterized protein n=2 Tax=Oryza sativa TaxID=4530 RepID=A3C166_ORYSJ|nr:hypothetical protein OsI_32263 [Oryza sativa Indica Group]EAZ45555.1 hypothetical protein OsJ_30216 [Oryza sativa Japonica Group]